MANYEDLSKQDLINIRKFIETSPDSSQVMDSPSKVSVREVFNEKKQRMMQDKKGGWVVAPTAPKLFDAEGNPVDETGALIPAKTEPRGKVVENAGELDYGGIKGLVNQLNNLLRPVARKVSEATPVGAVGTAVADTIQGIKEKQFSDNPLSRLFSDAKKGIKKSVAEIGQGDSVTLEDKLGSYLEQKFPELAKKAPKDTLRINAPEARGLKKFSGVGEFKSPYGRFILDESGTLRKV